MFKFRAGIAVILATIIGIVLLILALSTAQQAFQIRTAAREDLFTISGKAQFTERAEEKFWRPDTYVYVTLQEYPASFIITKKTANDNAQAFQTAIDTIARLTLPKNALGLLQTRSEIKVYELTSGKGNVIYSYATAVESDQSARLRLYLQAGFCLVAALVLLIAPKRYLVKQ